MNHPRCLIESFSCNCGPIFGLSLSLLRNSTCLKLYRVSQKKRTNKTNKNGQTWQACQHSKVVQRGPKGSKMVNLDVLDHLGPFWARLDPFEQFQTKISFCSKAPPQKVLDPFGPLWTPLDHFGMLTNLPCLAIFVCFIGAFFWDTL